MRFNCALILYVVLCNRCSTMSLVTREIESKNSRDELCRGELPHSLNGNRQNRTRFDELDGDVLYLTFHHFNVVELVNMAKIKPSLAYFAGKAFRQRYRNYEVIVCGRGNSYGILDNFKDHSKEKQLIITVDFELALNTLTYFGAHINRLEIDDRKLEQSQSRSIHKLVNEKSTEFLTHFTWKGAREDAFSQFTRPFNRVEDFKCSSDQKQIGHILPLNELLPKLKRFTLIIKKQISDYDFFNVNIRNLDHLEINILDLNYNSNQMASLEGIVRKNPQVRSATFGGFRDNFIGKINDLLPNVDNLNLRIFLLSNELFHLKYVKHFSLETFLAASVHKLTFEQLESMEMTLAPEFIRQWFQFFYNHRNLTRLSIEAAGFTNWNHIADVTAELPALVELRIKDLTKIDVDIITTIVRTHVQLRRFELPKPSALVMMALHELFDNEWNIMIKKDASEVLFERKVAEAG